MKSQEGYLLVDGSRIWYQVVGTSDGIPLLTIHGGPGSPHDDLEPLASLADERPIVFYDQLGTGRSDRPSDSSLWRMEHFVHEIDKVRQGLGMGRLHIFGHSWGTILAATYALAKPAGLFSLILASAALSLPRVQADRRRSRELLPLQMRETLGRHEAAGTTESKEYRDALAEWQSRFMCRVSPLPEPLRRSEAATNWQMIKAILSDEAFMSYECTDRLQEISVPTLLTGGRFDGITPPETITLYHDLISNSEMTIFERSAHYPHLEETEPYLLVVRDYIQRVERQRAGRKEP